jgi:hypothetical protein
MYHASHTQTVLHGRLGSWGRRTQSHFLRIDTPNDINDSDPCMSHAILMLISSYPSLTFQYPQRMSGHARIDVCEGQTLLLIGMQRDWYWICVSSSTSHIPLDRHKLTDADSSCLSFITSEEILDWRQRHSARRSILQSAWECTVKM